MNKRLSIIFAILAFVFCLAASATFFPDIIVTSPDGIWTDTRAYSNLSTAITAIGANERDVYIVREEVVTTLVIPANVRLHFLKTGAIANSNTLTLNTRDIHADHQIFTGAGAINFAVGTEVRTRWFEDFETAITQTSNDTVTLTVDTVDTLLNSAAVGDNVILKWNAYNPITIAAGQTLSNIGDISAPGIRLLTVSGSVAFKASSPLKEIRADWFGNTLATLDIADNAAAAAGKQLIITPGAWVIDTDLTLSSDLKILPGVDLQIATTKTLTISGSLDTGRYQIFSCTGTGKVSGLKTVYPEWFGAVGDGATDDTAALDATVAATDDGGVINVNGYYKTTGCLISKSLSLVSPAPVMFQGSSAYGFKAAGAQAYVLKFQGVFAGTAFIHPYLQNINIDGDDKAISDAALVMEYCNFGYLDRPSVQNVNGHGVRLRTCWETRIINPYIGNCGTIDTGSAIYIDGPSPFDAAYGTNNLRIIGGTWGANRGRWIDASNLANLDACWIEGNKFELDNATTPNTANTSVIYLGAASRTMILNNTFSGFGVTSDKYANLIYIGGHATEASQRGGPTNRVAGNRAAAYNPTSGAINGLYLDTYAPTCEEGDNTFVSYNGEICPNVNVSQYPQLINLTWRNQSGSLYPIPPLPNREAPEFISMHKVTRGTTAYPFVADADAISNAQTVLQLADADQANADICHLFDLTRFVGSYAKTLKVRVRAKLDDAGSVTLYGNTSNPAWSGCPVLVDSTAWAWYEMPFPISGITSVNHLLQLFYWQVNSGTANLLVDGIEFGLTDDFIETVTTGSPALMVGGVTLLNSAGGAITATLADGVFVGQKKVIVMLDATTSSTVTVAHHATSDPEVFTFATLGAYLELQWDGTDWVTVANHGATT